MSHLLGTVEINSLSTSLGASPAIELQDGNRKDSSPREQSTQGEILNDVSGTQAVAMYITFLSKGRTIIVIGQLSLLNFMNSVSNGILTVCLPRIAVDLNLAGNLLLW